MAKGPRASKEGSVPATSLNELVQKDKHTTGRLEVTSHPQDYGDTLLDAEGHAVAQTFWGKHRELEEAQANAHRLAAAWNAADEISLSNQALESGVIRELLHALEDTLPQLNWASCHGSRCDELISQVQDVIEKARGN